MKSEARKKKIRFDRVLTEQARQEIAAMVGDALRAHYPGHIWMVTVLQGGILQVVNPLLSKTKGFVLHLTNLDPELKIVMRAGGEMLERHNQRRGWIDEAALVEAPRNVRGDMIV